MYMLARFGNTTWNKWGQSLSFPLSPRPWLKHGHEVGMPICQENRLFADHVSKDWANGELKHSNVARLAHTRQWGTPIQEQWPSPQWPIQTSKWVRCDKITYQVYQTNRNASVKHKGPKHKHFTSYLQLTQYKTNVSTTSMVYLGRDYTFSLP